MGFKSVLGKIGKVALKAAPFAAMAIPGVGVPLGMAISGAANAASKKLEGGSWKDALISGGIGAGTAAIPGGGFGKVGGATTKGLAPTVGAVGKAVAKNTAKSVLGGMGKSVLSGMTGGGGGTGGSWKDALGGALTRGASGGVPDFGGGRAGVDSPYVMNASQGTAVPRVDPGMSIFHEQARRRLGPVMGNPDQNNPNLANPIMAGKMQAIKNQPFRKGYDVTSFDYTGTKPGEEPKKVVNRMPRIYSSGVFGRQRANGY